MQTATLTMPPDKKKTPLQQPTKVLDDINLILEAIKVRMTKMASSMMTMRVTTHHPSATLKHSTSKKVCPPYF
jgi:hypothetical protein